MSDEKQKKLLLVEDEAIIALSQKMFLEKYGYTVFTINTGEKAVEIFRKESEIELVILPESVRPPLEKIGYKVIVAPDAKKAIEIIKSDSDIDLVLMDIDLGKGMDGTQAAEEILGIKDIPILFLSSHTEPDVVKKTENITSYGYVVKNSSITVLDASIKMAFKLFYANQKVKNELIERKKVEKILFDSERKYRQLFETSKDGIIILNAETGAIRDVNPFMIDLLGYSYEAFLKKTIWDIGNRSDVIGNKDKFVELQNNQYVRYENLPLETNNGQVIEVEFISNVYEAHTGKVIQCNIRDITERKGVEAGLEKDRKELAIEKVVSDEASEFAENVINTVREPLLSLDQNLRIVTVNRSFYEMFKVEPEETIGHLIFDVGNKQWDIPKLRELLEKILPQHIVFDNFEVEHDFTTIGKRIMLLNARQIQQAASSKKVILLAIEDITERKVIEQKMKAILAEKNVVLREVHHRIKNNMNTILGLLNLQAESLTEPIAIAALKDAGSRVQSMMVLYDKLYRSVNYTELSIKEYLTSLIDEIIGNFPNRSIVKVEKSIEDFVVDAKALQTIGIIINELLTNIMKYAFIGRNSGLIRVSVSKKFANVSIIIQDDGRGVDETVSFEGSSGFGLMLVKLLTDQLGGSIKMERAGGTKMILVFQL